VLKRREIKGKTRERERERVKGREIVHASVSWINRVKDKNNNHHNNKQPKRA
jgi:hypothetical protein